MVSGQYAAVQQAGNGIIVAFDFNFKILQPTDLVVSKIDALGNPSGTLIFGVDYTVVFDPIRESGTATYTVAPVAGGFSLLERDTDNTQQTELPREGPMPAKTVETMVDKVQLEIQELQAAAAPQPSGELSGLYANKPVNLQFPAFYYSTDRGSYEKWVPTAGRWFLLG